MSNEMNPQGEPTPAPGPETPPKNGGEGSQRPGAGIPSGFLRSHAPDPNATPEAPSARPRRPRAVDAKARSFSAAERLHLLDVWQRSGLAATEFAALVGVNRYSLYTWKKKFETEGPAGLEDRPRGGGPRQKLSDLTRRAILMIKKAHPEYGCERISYLLQRGPALAASPATVTKVLHEAGYVLSDEPTHKHREFVRRFERASPNQLWQTDLFTFVLKRQNTRVYLVAFMDDHSRFIVGYGLHMSQSTALTLEVLRASITSYGRPEEVLTDNGTQYVTWRGKSAFTRECEKRGIKQIVSSPRHPQTLGKIERFWGTLWRECLESAVFQDVSDARKRIGLFIDHYNFQRPHQSCEGLVPADRFFKAALEVKKTLAARVAANALDVACNGVPRKPFYLTGQVDGKPFSIHAAGERLILTKEGGSEEIELSGKDAGQRILDIVSSRGMARLAYLREELKDLSRSEIDAALLALEEAEAISLAPSDPSVCTASDRESALVDPVRGLLVVAFPRKVPGPETMPDAVCPDGSPTGELPPDDDTTPTEGEEGVVPQ